MPNINIDSENVRFLSIGLCISAAIISLISIFIVRINKKRDMNGSLYLLGFVLMNLLLALAYVTELVLTGQPGTTYHILMYIAVILEFAIPFILSCILTYYIIYQIEVYVGWQEYKYYFAVVYAIVATAIPVCVYTNFFFYIDEANYYHRCPGFIYSQAIGLILLAVNSILYLKNRSEIQETERMTIKTFIIIPFLAIMGQVFLAGLNIFVLSTTLCALMMIVFIQIRQNTDYSLSEQKLAELRFNMLVSQMRPHFLYNALSSISQLCKKDPIKASEMTDKFAEFLRKNMTDINKREPIPFSKELAHIQNYISIEQMRFGDSIKVEYDIQTYDFCVPALVLQPIVENAIKHGIRMRDDGGVLRISTRRVGESCVLTIADDGVGFDPKILKHDDGRTHLGLSSVIKRVNKMKGVSVNFTSKPGIGTTVVFLIEAEDLIHDASNSKISSLPGQTDSSADLTDDQLDQNDDLDAAENEEQSEDLDIAENEEQNGDSESDDSMDSESEQKEADPSGLTENIISADFTGSKNSDAEENSDQDGLSQDEEKEAEAEPAQSESSENSDQSENVIAGDFTGLSDSKSVKEAENKSEDTKEEMTEKSDSADQTILKAAENAEMEKTSQVV